MICISTKKHGVKRNTVWLYNGEKLPRSDINIFVQSFKKPPFNFSEFDSLYSDLTLQQDELIKRIDKDCRYEIRRAERDGIKFECFGLDKEINDNILNEFISFYKSNAKVPSEELNTIEKIKLANNIIILRAKLDDECLVYYGFATGEKKARHTHSASLYVHEDKKRGQILGRASRYLMYKTIITFKNAGYLFLDYGGISDREEIKNITKFKKEFGGIEWTGYNYVTYNTIKGKLYQKIIQLLKG